MTTATPGPFARAEATQASWRRRYPVGAEVTPQGSVHFRVWAAAHRRVALQLEDEAGQVYHSAALTAEGNGYFSGEVKEASAGALYRLRLDGDESYPDPASRYQPSGPHGPSAVVDPHRYQWQDVGWAGVSVEGQVIYELHTGTFTPEGTWASAARKLSYLHDLGVSLIELMPVAEFPGEFGWGYDGVDLFAPSRLYGTPDELREFVDRAHARGIGVILDVVYNHFGPDGCYLRTFAPAYFSERHTTEWGDALNYDGDDSGPVREFITANAAYWIDEFHLDGLRLDATQSIYDDSPRHILTDIGAAARRAAGERSIVLIAENEVQEARLVEPPAGGGYGLDAIWNDDFHHTARVALTGRNEAYYRDYGGTAQEFVSALKWGFLFQGQRYAWQDKRRGSPTFGVPSCRFIHYLENHDQVANSASGLRLFQLASPARLRALTAVLLLGPETPLLFQGQEFGSSAPFTFFADHRGELGERVRAGRLEFLSQFESVRLDDALRRQVPDPTRRTSFERSRLDWTDAQAHQQLLRLHVDLIRLRREDPVLRAQGAEGVDGAVLTRSAWALRFFSPDATDRLLLVNLGAPLSCDSISEPLLAPPRGGRWTQLWSSEAVPYGGTGASPPETPEGRWHLPGDVAVVLAAYPDAAPTD